MKKHGIALPAAAVEAVADNRAAETQLMSGMQAELVGSAGQWDKFYSGPGMVFLSTQGKALPAGDPEFSLHWIVNLVRAVVWIQAEAQFNFSVFFAHRSVQQGNIDFFHLPLRELAAEMAMGLSSQGQNHQAGGGHVQPMDSGLGRGRREGCSESPDYTVLLIPTASRHRE